MTRKEDFKNIFEQKRLEIVEKSRIAKQLAADELRKKQLREHQNILQMQQLDKIVRQKELDDEIKLQNVIELLGIRPGMQALSDMFYGKLIEEYQIKNYTNPRNNIKRAGIRIAVPFQIHKGRVWELTNEKIVDETINVTGEWGIGGGSYETWHYAKKLTKEHIVYDSFNTIISNSGKFSDLMEIEFQLRVNYFRGKDWLGRNLFELLINGDSVTGIDDSTPGSIYVAVNPFDPKIIIDYQHSLTSTFEVMQKITQR
jgi:hypothetical protein